MLPASYRKLVAIKHSRDFRAVARIVEVPLPTPGAFEVVVKNRFAGVNASDVNISAGVYLRSEPPFDLGVEAVGEVVAVGDKVAHLSVGQPVLTFNPGGGYREYQVVNAMVAIAVPEASRAVLTLGVSALTAAIGLFEVGQMVKGETVLVTAAAGATGSYAVQLSKALGNHVIATCGGEHKAKLLRELGCDRVVDHTREALGEVLAKEYPRGVNLVYEGVGSESFDAALEHLSIRGRIVVVGYISEYERGAQPVLQPRVYEKLLWKSAQIRAFLLSHYADRLGVHLVALLEQLKRGDLKAIVDDTDYLGLEAVCEAVEALYAGKNTGKVSVRFS
jgi:NADPH-dependent curcumin reductase CurA